MEEKTQICIEKKERPHSFEFGKAGNRWKLYFEDASDLKKLIDSLTESGIMLTEGDN